MQRHRPLFWLGPCSSVAVTAACPCHLVEKESSLESPVILHLNLLHLVLVICAAACVYVALLDVRADRPTGPWRLALLPAWAMLPALILVLFQLATRQSPWLLAAPFVVGLAAGGLRGFTMLLQFDRNYRVVRPKGRRVLLWVSLAVPVAVALEIAGSVVGRATAIGAPLRLAGAELALLCAGLLVGRGLALAIRLLGAPHVDLRRN
jgi:FtsH-binding integral membrane protein